jgi:hypothetical protein
MDLSVSGVVPLEQMVGDDENDTALLRQMSIEAKAYLEQFDWCSAVGRGYWGGGVGKVFSVFLFEIEPKTPDVDHWLWVIVGEIPPLYLVTDQCLSPKEAADMYIELMTEWVTLAREGRSSPDLPSAGVEPTPEWAENLAGRLAFIREKILPLLNN